MPRDGVTYIVDGLRSKKYNFNRLIGASSVSIYCVVIYVRPSNN